MRDPKILSDLNIKEKLYAKWRAVDTPKKDAAIKAGYKPSAAQHQAWQLEKRPKIQLAIDYYREEVLKEADMGVKDIIKRMELIAKKQDIYSEKADNKTCLKALEDLAKIHGVEGLSDIVKIQYDPLDKLGLEEIRELAEGRIPAGKSGTFVEDLCQAILRATSKESGTSINRPQ